MASYYYHKKSHTLPRKRREISDSPFRSANPIQLHEVTTNAQLDYVDDASAKLFRTCGVEHPVQCRTMKEYDQQISELKKENFNLKLRIFFLEERMQRIFKTADVEEVHKKNIELQVDLESCKKEILDKQKLLLKASATLEGLERQHCSDLEKQKRDFEKEIRKLQDEVLELRKDPKCDVSIQQRNSIELYCRAFPDLELGQAGSSVFEGSVSIEAEKELRFARIFERNAELERVVGNQTAQIKEFEEYKIKSEKLVRGLLVVCQEKSDDVKSLQENLEAKVAELLVLKKRLSEFVNNGGQLTGNGDASLSKHELGPSWDSSGLEHLVLQKQFSSLRSDLRLRNDALLKVTNLLPQLRQEKTSIGDVDFKCLEDAVNAATSPQEIDLDFVDEVLESRNDSNYGSLGMMGNLMSRSSRTPVHLASSPDKKEVIRLNFKLAATEATVRTLATKTKFFRQMLAEAGMLSTVPLGKLHNSESDLRQLSVDSHRKSKKKFRSTNTLLPLEIPAVGCSTSAPTTPVISPRPSSETSTQTSGYWSGLIEKLRDAKAHGQKLVEELKVCRVEAQEAILRMKMMTEEKADLLKKLDAMSETCRKNEELEERKAVLENELQYKELELEQQEIEFVELEKDMGKLKSDLEKACMLNVELQQEAQEQAGTRQELSCIRKFAVQSQTGFGHLKQRLEELCVFLESLLKFDANGILDVSDLTPQKVMSIKYHLNLSRDLTGSLSESMLVLGNLSVCNNSQIDFDQTNSMCDNGVSLVQNNTSDNFVLMLQSDGGQQMSSRLNGMMEELPTFSIDFTPSQSMMVAKDDARNVPFASYSKMAVAKDSSLSESDSWSEPDRNVSLQRMGLDEHVRSPKQKSTCRNRAALGMDSESGASSELAQLARLQQKRFPKLNFGMRRARSEDSDVRRLQARVQALEGLNDSLRAELKIYYSLQTVVGTASSETETEVKSKLETSADGLMEPLKEIAALRERLEESILAYEWLREEFEKRLECVVPSVLSAGKGNDVDYKSSCGESTETTDIGHLKALLAEKEALTRDLCEANERLRCTVDMVSGLLSEKDTVIRQREEELQRGQESRAKVTDANRQLEENLKEVSVKISDQERRVAELTVKLRESETALLEATEKRSEAERTAKRVAASHEDDKCRLRDEILTVQRDLQGALGRLREEEEAMAESQSENLALREKLVDLLKSKEAVAQFAEGDTPRAGIDVGKLLTEIKHLRLQLERSIDTNTALRTRLESEEACQSQCAQYYSVAAEGGNRVGQPPGSIDGQADSNSVYSSPDLGIESDRSQFSSLDCRVGREINNGWTWPAAHDRDTADRSYLRHTFHGDFSQTSKCQLEVENTCSSIKTICSTTCGHELANVKKEIIAAMQVVKQMKGKFGGLSDSIGCGDPRDVVIYCSSIYKQLKECVKLIEQYQPNNFDNERELMAAQISKLQQQLALQKNMCSETMRKLRTAVRFKEGMEKAIIKQLSKTHSVLQKARGNLELQEKKS